MLRSVLRYSGMSIRKRSLRREGRRRPPPSPHKADQSAPRPAGSEKTSSIDAIQEYRIILKNVGILQVIHVIAENRLVSPGHVSAIFCIAKLAFADRVVIVTSGRSDRSTTRSFLGALRSYSRLLARECRFNLLLDLSGNAVRAGRRDKMPHPVQYGNPWQGGRSFQNLSPACHRSGEDTAVKLPACGSVPITICHGFTSNAMNNGLVPP